MSTTPDQTPLEMARARLQRYYAAEAKILESQEYNVGQGGTARRNRRADLQSVQAGIKAAKEEIALLETQGPTGTPARRVFYVRPF